MSEERLSLVEREIHAHKTEMKIIASTMEKLVEQGEKTHELIHQALLRDERFEAKLRNVESQIMSKLSTQHGAITRAHTRVDKIENLITKVALFIVLAVAGSVMSLVLI